MAFRPAALPSDAAVAVPSWPFAFTRTIWVGPGIEVPFTP